MTSNKIIFLQYRELYFEGGVSSVYLWDLDAGFAGVILIKKAGDGSKKIKGLYNNSYRAQFICLARTFILRKQLNKDNFYNFIK